MWPGQGRTGGQWAEFLWGLIIGLELSLASYRLGEQCALIVDRYIVPGGPQETDLLKVQEGYAAPPSHLSMSSIFVLWVDPYQQIRQCQCNLASHTVPPELEALCNRERASIEAERRGELGSAELGLDLDDYGNPVWQREARQDEVLVPRLRDSPSLRGLSAPCFAATYLMPDSLRCLQAGMEAGRLHNGAGGGHKGGGADGRVRPGAGGPRSPGDAAAAGSGSSAGGRLPQHQGIANAGINGCARDAEVAAGGARRAGGAAGSRGGCVHISVVALIYECIICM